MTFCKIAYQDDALNPLNLSAKTSSVSPPPNLIASPTSFIAQNVLLQNHHVCLQVSNQADQKRPGNVKAPAEYNTLSLHCQCIVSDALPEWPRS